MITVHCTYPDGETSEARYGLTMAQALYLLDDGNWPGWPGSDEVNASDVLQPWDTLVDIPAFGGES